MFREYQLAVVRGNKFALKNVRLRAERLEWNIKYERWVDFIKDANPHLWHGLMNPRTQSDTDA